jgi:hypothetical protein
MGGAALLLPLLLLANAAAAALLLLPPAQALSQDGLRLLDAKRALTTVPAAALADWDPRHATPCNWTGVTCDASSSVTGISLPSLDLAGPFPAAALCRLPRLRSVDLSGNYLGPDLRHIARCTALQRLDLSTNSFVGPLPDALADLPSLLYLNLQGNNFSGPIPGSFARFPRHIKVAGGKAGSLGDSVTISREKTKVTVTSDGPFSKRYTTPNLLCGVCVVLLQSVPQLVTVLV